MFNFENLKPSWIILQNKMFNKWQILFGLLFSSCEIRHLVWFPFINLLSIVFHLVKEK